MAALYTTTEYSRMQTQIKYNGLKFEVVGVLTFDVRYSGEVTPPPVCRFIQWRTQELCSEGVQQIQLRTEDRESGDLGGGSPLVRGSGGSCNLVQIQQFLN